MITLAQVQNKIGELEASLTGIDEQDRVKLAEIDILYWYKNSNNLRTEQEVHNKINRLEEEMFFLSQQDVNYLTKSAKIKQLQQVLT